MLQHNFKKFVAFFLGFQFLVTGVPYLVMLQKYRMKPSNTTLELKNVKNDTVVVQNCILKEERQLKTIENLLKLNVSEEWLPFLRGILRAGIH